jgi:anaerobic selenocysteine-containing dehydrogenase
MTIRNPDGSATLGFRGSSAERSFGERPPGYVSARPIARSAADVSTICVLCSQNCGVRVDVTDNALTAVRADDRNPITKGYVCNKAFSIPHYVEHAQRVTSPMKRRPDGSFERVSWDQAIGEIGAKLRGLLDRHPPRAVALIGGGGQGNHLDVPYALAFLAGIGSPMWFSALAQEKTQHALVDRWMFRAPLTGYLHADTERSRYVLLLGTNPVVSNRGYRARDFLREMKKDPGRRLVVVDPRRTETARFADRHLAIRPATDCWFLLGVAAEIVAKGRHDARFIGERTQDFDRVAAALRAVDTAEMARRCGLAADDITEVAAGFAAAESASLFYDLGIEQAPFSTLNAYLVRLILALTGNIGNPGGAVFHGTFSPTAPDLAGAPARALVSGIEAIQMLTPYGMFSPNLVPEEVLTDHPDRIRAVFVEGANPLVQYADTRRYREAFDRLDLSVVIDPAFTETARRAHYVLPAPVGYEKWEFSAFPKRYPEIDMQVRPPVVSGPPEAMPEAEIFARLSRAAGLLEPAPRMLHALGKRAQTPAGAAAYLAALPVLAAARGVTERGLRAAPNATLIRTVFWLYETLGPHLPAPSLSALWALCLAFGLTRRDAVARTFPSITKSRVAVGLELFQKLLDHPEGVELARLDERRNFEEHCGFSDGRMRLAPEPMLAEIRRALHAEPATNADFPLIMNGGLRTHWNANTLQRDPAWRKGTVSHDALRISPGDAERLGVRSGDQVLLETPRGQVSVEALVDDGVQVGHVSIPNGAGTEYPDRDTGELRRTGVNVNELTDAAARDPFTGCPHHKSIPCRVTPAGEPGGATPR